MVICPLTCGIVAWAQVTQMRATTFTGFISLLLTFHTLRAFENQSLAAYFVGRTSLLAFASLFVCDMAWSATGPSSSKKSPCPIVLMFRTCQSCLIPCRASDWSWFSSQTGTSGSAKLQHPSACSFWNSIYSSQDFQVYCFSSSGVEHMYMQNYFVSILSGLFTGWPCTTPCDTRKLSKMFQHHLCLDLFLVLSEGDRDHTAHWCSLDGNPAEEDVGWCEKKASRWCRNRTCRWSFMVTESVCAFSCMETSFCRESQVSSMFMIA